MAYTRSRFIQESSRKRIWLIGTILADLTRRWALLWPHDSDFKKTLFKMTLSSLQTVHQHNWTPKKKGKERFSSKWPRWKIQVNHVNHKSPRFSSKLGFSQGMLWACSFGQTLSQRFLDAARDCLVAYGRSLETTAPGEAMAAMGMEEPPTEWWWLDHVPPWDVEISN